MTVIAWDGTTLAADKRMSRGTIASTTTKIRRIHGRLVAFSGHADAGEALMAWLAAGADPKDYPALQKDNDSNVDGVVIEPGGSISIFSRGPVPIQFDKGQTFAAGSGRDFAMMAMRLGKTAAEAVLLAAEFDPSCGNGVDTLSFESDL